MGTLTLILILVAAAITLWAVFRKGVSGLPLILGVWGIILCLWLGFKWTYPTPEQIALLAFLIGASLTLLVWGCVNVFIEIAKLKEKFFEKVSLSEKCFVIVSKHAKSPYGVLYGVVPWNDEGASILLQALNEKIWAKGYKIEQLNVEYAEIGGISTAWIMGIIRPKTIIDRILY